jgi:hypothetical protein
MSNKSKIQTRISRDNTSLVMDMPGVEEFGTRTEVLKSHLGKISASGYQINIRQLPETGKSVSHAKTLART